jgi:predicted NUDIX family NTP pyrophosphohydrolase
MVKKLSAALLVHRLRSADGPLEVLIVHPGGPFWARKDAGAWSIPKGEYDEGEDPLKVAQREFVEEVGKPVPDGEIKELATVKQPSGKVITAFAVRGDLDLTGTQSNTFEMEWPKGSGKMQAFPEVDKAEWFNLATARTKLLKGQLPFIDALVEQLTADGEVFVQEDATGSEEGANEQIGLF